MDDVDALAGNLARQPRLLRQRVDAAEGRNLIFLQRDAELVQLLDEGSPPAETGKPDVEPRSIEHAPQRHELVLGPAAHQRGNDVQNPRAHHECTAVASV